MVIRKEFRVESSHIVRNASSFMCSHSTHGHSAVIEVMLEGSKLDNAGMLYDFGLMKSTIKQFIDSSDHCHLIWSKDEPEYKEFFKKTNDRWIELPFNPSAENLSMYYMRGIQKADVEKIGKIYSRLIGQTYTFNSSCSRCILKLIKLISSYYYDGRED